jgi:hypothetical protein
MSFNYTALLIEYITLPDKLMRLPDHFLLNLSEKRYCNGC